MSHCSLISQFSSHLYSEVNAKHTQSLCYSRPCISRVVCYCSSVSKPSLFTTPISKGGDYMCIQLCFIDFFIWMNICRNGKVNISWLFPYSVRFPWYKFLWIPQVIYGRSTQWLVEGWLNPSSARQHCRNGKDSQS